MLAWCANHHDQSVTRKSYTSSEHDLGGRFSIGALVPGTKLKLAVAARRSAQPLAGRLVLVAVLLRGSGRPRVGYFDQTLVETMSGSTWRTTPSPVTAGPYVDD